MVEIFYQNSSFTAKLSEILFPKIKNFQNFPPKPMHMGLPMPPVLD
jgi:hypothetical protein